MILFLAEDLVLAEDRTTEADRELIMEGVTETFICICLLFSWKNEPSKFELMTFLMSSFGI